MSSSPGLSSIAPSWQTVTRGGCVLFSKLAPLSGSFSPSLHKQSPLGREREIRVVTVSGINICWNSVELISHVPLRVLSVDESWSLPVWTLVWAGTCFPVDSLLSLEPAGAERCDALGEL